MIERSINSGIPFTWVAGDSVYGDNRHLRMWLEDKEKAYVFTVSGKEYVAAGFNQYRVSEILGSLPQDGWVRMSAGNGSKGPRLYDWLLLGINSPEIEGWKRWLLVRRSTHEPYELKAHVVCAPAQTDLSKMVRAAGIRWAVEVSFEDAKQETGLDEYEVRAFTAWYRHITLSMFAYALLGVLKKNARDDFKKTSRFGREVSRASKQVVGSRRHDGPGDMPPSLGPRPLRAEDSGENTPLVLLQENPSSRC